MSARIAGSIGANCFPRSTARSAPCLAPLLLLAFAGCAHKKPALQTFHYRAAARPLAVGERWTPQLDGDSPNGYASSVKFHLEQTGVLQLSTQTSSPKVAVLIYTAGKTALVHKRAGTAIETPPIAGDVFVVIRALKGSGPVRVQVDSGVAPSAPGVQPAPPTPDAPAKADATPEANKPDAKAGDASDPNDLPLDDLLAN